MAFGHGKQQEHYDFRAVPLNMVRLSKTKCLALESLRRHYNDAANSFCHLAFHADPLVCFTNAEGYRQRMLVLQKECGLNQAYAEKAARDAITKLMRQQTVFIERLFGRLHHCGEKIPAREKTPDTLDRHYYYVPVAVQTLFTPADETALHRLAERGFTAICAMVNDTVKRKPIKLSTTAQAVLAEIWAQSLHFWVCPYFKDDGSVSIALDARVLTSAYTDIHAALSAQLLRDKTNTTHQFTLSLSAAAPHQPRLNLPLALSRSLLKRYRTELGTALEMSSLTLVLHANSTAEMRLVVAKKKEPVQPMGRAQAILARDYGIKNSVAWTVMAIDPKLDGSLDEARIAQIRAFTKVEMKDFLETHTYAGTQKKFQLLFSGTKFVSSIEKVCLRIDALRSQIDQLYIFLLTQKSALAASLGIDNEQKIHKEMVTRSHPQWQAVNTFLQLVHRVAQLKDNRRVLYQRIEGIKKSWFGFLSNMELDLAMATNAVVATEDLTYVAKEKNKPGYRGKTFNRVLNHTARGRYARMARQKFAWHGVAEAVLPSYYTSTSCVKHALVKKTMRKDEQFTCPYCNTVEHADVHASETLAVILVAKPLDFHVTKSPFNGKHRPSGR